MNLWTSLFPRRNCLCLRPVLPPRCVSLPHQSSNPGRWSSTPSSAPGFALRPTMPVLDLRSLRRLMSSGQSRLSRRSARPKALPWTGWDMLSSFWWRWSVWPFGKVRFPPSASPPWRSLRWRGCKRRNCACACCCSPVGHSGPSTT